MKALIDIEELIPGELGLDSPSLVYLLTQETTYEQMFPIPVRLIDETTFTNLDGRHRLIIGYLQNIEQLDAYRPHDRVDTMEASDFPNLSDETLYDQNRNIMFRWEKVAENAMRHKKQFGTFANYMNAMQEEYPFLESFQTLKAYAKEEHERNATTLKNLRM